MPSTSDAMRRLMDSWFHNGGISEAEPYAFLIARGWTETGGFLHKPTSAYTPSIYEQACAAFLREEWDFGYNADAMFPFYRAEFNL